MRWHSVVAKAAAALMLFTASRVPLMAQEGCISTETLGECWKRLYDPDSGKKQTEAASWQQLAGKATGLNSSKTSNSAIQDFLPLMDMALVGSGQKSGNDLKALDFERKITVNKSLELKLKGSRNDPDIYDPLKQEFPANQRDQEVAKLKGQLGDFDDYSFTVSGNVLAWGYGRSWNAGQSGITASTVFGSLFSQMVGNADMQLRDKANEGFRKALQRGGAGVNQNTRFDSIADLKLRADLMATLAEAARGLKSDIANLQALATSLGIFKVADLVNNQPQINGSATYRIRRGLAGPNELSVKASYERGFANLNELLKTCPSTTDIECYARYINDPATTAALEHGDRFAFSVEYKDHQAFRASLPADGIDLKLPSGRSLIASLTYGRYIDLKALGNSNSRIDLTASYENVSGDPTRKDRGVASLTYSNQFLQSLGASLGISYANHSEFLPKSDHTVSAHFAISYKLHSDTPQ